MNKEALKNLQDEINIIKNSKHNIESGIDKLLAHSDKKNSLEALKKIIFYSPQIDISSKDEIEELYTIINHFKINALTLYSQSVGVQGITNELLSSIRQATRDILSNKTLNPKSSVKDDKNEYEQKTIIEKNSKLDIFDKELLSIFKRITELEDSFEKIEKKVDEKNYLEFIDKSQQLFEKAKQAESLVDSEIQELKKAKEGHIAYTLSDKLEKKLSNCRIDKYIKLLLLCFAIIGMLVINYFLLGFSSDSIKDNKFWELLAMKVLFNIPLAFLVLFFLNEYNKAKRLFEEIDYKIIMAQTLMNNYNKLKDDFTKDEEKLLDLLKTPIEKIFENPVHSVFGDKSGDKGLGIDHLEKLMSIADKLKGKKD